MEEVALHVVVDSLDYLVTFFLFIFYFILFFFKFLFLFFLFFYFFLFKKKKTSSFFLFLFFFLSFFFCARVGLRPRTVHSVGNPVQPIFPSNNLSIHLQVLQDFHNVNSTTKFFCLGIHN